MISNLRFLQARGKRIIDTTCQVAEGPFPPHGLNLHLLRLLRSDANRRDVVAIPEQGNQNEQDKEVRSDPIVAPYKVARPKNKFIDSLRIMCKAGCGGHGLPQFGGIGGKGGDVYVKGSGSKDLNSLLSKNPKKKFVAQDGSNASKHQLVGDPGADFIIECPLGVTIEDDEKQIIGDINKVEDQILVALGGRSGEKSNNNIGAVGQKRMIKLDLKMIADIGLVGFPNAGKSTMLKSLSRANPRIANFPFTTLAPNIGVMEFPDFRRITLTDLPGLVEGAHKNIGFGHSFLKHATRTKLIAFVIDINGFDIGPNYPKRSALESLLLLQRELQLYDDSIFLKPAVLLLSQMDRDGSEVKLKKFSEEYSEILEPDYVFPPNLDDRKPTKLMQIDSILPVSCKTGYNIHKLKSLLRNTLDKYAEMEKIKTDGIENYKQIASNELNRISPNEQDLSALQLQKSSFLNITK